MINSLLATSAHQLFFPYDKRLYKNFFEKLPFFSYLFHYRNLITSFLPLLMSSLFSSKKLFVLLLQLLFVSFPLSPPYRRAPRLGEAHPSHSFSSSGSTVGGGFPSLFQSQWGNTGKSGFLLQGAVKVKPSVWSHMTELWFKFQTLTINSCADCW